MRGYKSLFRPKDWMTTFVVVALAVWPVLHGITVRTLDISSWRFGGWGMYATPTPLTSHVLVVVRSCHANGMPTSRSGTGPHSLLLDSDSAVHGRLLLDEVGHGLARDLSALRQDGQALAFDAWLRRTHSIDQQAAIAIAVVEPRIDLRGRRALGQATVAVVRDGEVVARERFVSSVARFGSVLPHCEVAS